MGGTPGAGSVAVSSPGPLASGSLLAASDSLTRLYFPVGRKKKRDKLDRYPEEEARKLALTGKTKHRDAPPDAPAPADEAEEDREQLADPDDDVDYEGADPGLGSGRGREPRLATAQVEHAAEHAACFTNENSN